MYTSVPHRIFASDDIGSVRTLSRDFFRGISADQGSTFRFKFTSN